MSSLPSATAPTPPRPRRRLPGILLAAAAFAAAPSSGARAQGDAVELLLEAPAEVRTCDELAVVLRVRAPGTAVGGYQVFLGYPAATLEPLRFEAGSAETESLQVAGPPPIGSGITACPDAGEPWDDGQGVDVVAVAATSTGEGDDVPPLVTDGEAELGRVVFRPRPEVTAGTVAEVTLLAGPCGGAVDRTTRAFAPDGGSLETTTGSAAEIALREGGAPVTGLACAFVSADAVELSWDPAEGIDRTRIYRDGELLDELAPGEAMYLDETVGGRATVEYEVAHVEAGVESCETAACAVSLEGVFRRGDVDANGSYNITDGVTLLRQLFEGVAIPCEDASDANDDGRVNISDAVFVLGFLFRSGEEPPPPFPDLGEDPTPDDLGCDTSLPPPDGA